MPKGASVGKVLACAAAFAVNRPEFSRQPEWPLLAVSSLSPRTAAGQKQTFINDHVLREFYKKIHAILYDQSFIESGKWLDFTRRSCCPGQYIAPITHVVPFSEFKTNLGKYADGLEAYSLVQADTFGVR